jgi:Cys-rich repeat protein
MAGQGSTANVIAALGHVLAAAAGFSLAACAHEARPAGEAPPRAAAAPIPPATASQPPSGDPPEITQGRGTIADLEARCAKRHPECRHPFLQYVGSPHPCAGRGASCRAEDLAGWEPRWACSCEQCATDADCAAGERCAAGSVGCPPERVARRCERGPRGIAPREPVCLDPPGAAR